jgi:hypothetical protein
MVIVFLMPHGTINASNSVRPMIGEVPMSDPLPIDAGRESHQPEVSDASSTQYYVARDKVKKGPFSLAQLSSAARDGTLRPADMVLPDGTQKWRAANEISGLFPAPPDAPPVAVTASAARPASLFISYRRADSPDTVKLIHERLKQRLPRWEIFYDHESIPLGEQFPDLLRVKVTTATAVLVIIGPKWLEILRKRKSTAIDHVREEVRLALEAGASVVPCWWAMPPCRRTPISPIARICSRCFCAMAGRSVRTRTSPAILNGSSRF